MSNEQETALATRPRMPIATMHDAATLATAFAQAHVMGAQNPAEGMLAVTLIHEVGLVKAESTYHIMMGRLSKKAEAILADFVKAGGRYKILQRDALGAAVVASMGDTKDATFSFSWEDALQEPFVYANKNELKKPVAERTFKDKYATPRSRMQMLWARLVSDMGRALCPAATDGMYPPEEVADFDDVQPRGQTIDVAEVSKRTKATAIVNAPAISPDRICPAGFGEYSGQEWEMIPDDILDAAFDSDDERITTAHKAVIKEALKFRRELPK